CLVKLLVLEEGKQIHRGKTFRIACLSGLDHLLIPAAAVAGEVHCEPRPDVPDKILQGAPRHGLFSTAEGANLLQGDAVRAVAAAQAGDRHEEGWLAKVGGTAREPVLTD